MKLRAVEGGESLGAVRRAALAWAAWLAAMWVSHGPGREAEAQTGFGCVSSGNGVQMRVDLSWVDTSGYRPVTVEVTASGAPSPVERTFSVRLRARHQFMRSSPAVTVVEHFVMPAGSNQASVVLTLPMFFMWNQFDVELYEDGVYLDVVSQRDMYFGQSSNWNNVWMPILLVTSDTGWSPLPLQLMQGSTTMRRRFPVPPPAPGVGLSSKLLSPPPEVDLATVLPFLNQSRQMNQAAVTHVPALPERWQQYLALDVVLIALDDLLELARSHPRRREALCGWVHAGGTLIVGGLHEDYSRLDELERALGLAAVAGSGDDLRGRGWIAADPARWSPPTRTEVTWQPPGPDDRPFVLHRYGLGTVVGLGSEGPVRMSPSEWGWLANSLSQQTIWAYRYGIDFMAGNADFWRFLIPGVGLAPRWAFLLLITIFVVVIGPANYYWLRRRRKLYLLLVVVPTFAALVTMGLFAYAVVGDGLGVRVRVRSITEIDQRAGRATSWARLSYYAGLAPAAGLTFSDDVALLPIEPEDMFESRPQHEREVEWADGKQYMRRGWLASRVPKQYLALRTRTTKAGLRILGRADKGLRVRNELGVNLERLLVCDEQGQLFAATSLGGGAEAVLAPAELAEQSAAWRAALFRYPLEYPEGFDPYKSGFRRRAWQYGYSSGFGGSGFPAAGLMEATITRLLQACDGDGKALLSEPRTYLAIGASSPEIELGVNAKPEASLFLIQGRW